MKNKHNSAEQKIKRFAGTVFEVSTSRLWHSEANRQTRHSTNPLKSVKGYREAVPQLQLSLTYACNMDCSYCSFRSRMQENGRPLNMTKDVAELAVDFFAENVLPFTKYARIDFGLTGETFLRHKIHRSLRNEIEKRTLKTRAKAIWTGPCTTNGTLSRTVGIESEMGPPQDISCDGPRDVHDAVRPYVNGGGTYDNLMPLIREVLERHPDIGVTAVLTNRCTDFDIIFNHLYEDLGFRSIYMKPVNLPPNEPGSLNHDSLENFKTGYSRLIDYILDQSDEKIVDYLSSLNAEDFFMRYFYRIVNQSLQIYRCGAGKSGVYVDTDGMLFPCAHFIGKTGYSIGSVEVGFDETERQRYRDLTVESREPCKSCWAKYLCGGGCYYQAVLANGDITKPDEAKCELIRHLSTLAIRLFSRLANEKPDVLAALPIEFHIPSSSINSNFSDHYEPVSKLAPKSDASPDSLNLLTRQFMESCLASIDEVCELKIVGVNGGLDISFNCSEETVLEKIEFWLIDLSRESIEFGDLKTFSPSLFGETIRWSGGKNLYRRIDSESGSLKAVPYSKPKWLGIAEGDTFNSLGQWRIWLNLQEIFEAPAAAISIGFNLKCHFQGGRKASLVRSEPFCLVDITSKGVMSLSTPLWSDPSARDALNDSAFEGLVPVSQWQGFQANVC